MKIYLVGFGSQAENVASVFDEHNFVQIPLEGISSLPPSPGEFFCPAIGDSRKSFYATKEMMAKGFVPYTLKHETAFIHETSSLGVGSQIFANAYIGPNAIIAPHAVVNTGAIVEHNSTVGGHAFIAPGAILLGGVDVGELATVGANATILPKLSLGIGSVLAAGSVMTKSFETTGATLVGIPARQERPVESGGT